MTEAVGFFDDAVGVEAAAARGGQATLLQRGQIVKASVAATRLWCDVVVPTVRLGKLPPVRVCI